MSITTQTHCEDPFEAEAERETGQGFSTQSRSSSPHLQPTGATSDPLCYTKPRYSFILSPDLKLCLCLLQFACG